MSRRAGLLLSLLSITGLASCASRAVVPRALPAEAGVLYLYIDPLPEEAAGLRIEVGSVAALDATGTAHPFELRLERLVADASSRQRLLAMGALPAGPYRGLAVRFSSARLQGPKVPALDVGSEPLSTEASFSIEAGSATVLVARLQVAAAPAPGARFDPAISVAAPGALAPDLYAVATSGGDAALVVFHKLTGAVFDVLRTGAAPAGVALEVERQLAFVATSESDTLEVYDLGRKLREQRFPLLAGDRPLGIALTPDGRAAACALAGSNVLGIYEAPVLTERFRVEVGLEPTSVVVHPAGRRAFVFNSGSNSISVVDLDAGAVLATLATDSGPVHGAFDRSARRLYVIHRDSPYLLSLSLPRLAAEQRIYVGPGAAAIAVDPRTDRVFLGRRGTGRIEVFEPTSLLPLDTIELGDDAVFLAVSRDGDRLYAATPRAREVRSIPLAGSRTAAITDLGRDPAWIAVAGER